MINVQKIIAPPKDFTTMVARKQPSNDYMLNGIVVSKKSGKAYNVEIQINTKTLEANSNVKVSCSCDDFKFRWAAVLHKEGALLNPKNFRLDEPKVTNPNGIQSACKHIHTFMKTEMDNTLRGFSGRKGSL